MNFVGSQISDAMQVWDNANKTGKDPASGGREKSKGRVATGSGSGRQSEKQSSVDMTFITPSILGACQRREVM
jgi:hypothetical protein